MKLQLIDKALLRIPQFPENADIPTSWEALKESIKLSSCEFYDQIKEVSQDEIEKLSPSVLNTLWKYFNRAKHRATPYGTFAGLGIVNISGGGDKKVIIDPDQIQHRFIDWPYKSNIIINIETLLANDGSIIANNSYYALLNTIRYLSYIDNKFELSEVDGDPTVLKILNFCRQPIKASELQENLAQDFNGLEDLHQSLNYLIELQLLFTSFHPNIIGRDYFDRIGIENSPPLPQYVISERKIISPAIENNYFKTLPALAMLLQQIMPETRNDKLEKFITDFTRKFELQEISLMRALDPETGISYGEMDQASSSIHNLVTEFAGLTKKAEEIPANHLKNFLTQELISANTNLSVIIDLAKLPFNKNVKTKLPNTFSVILSDADGTFCLENIGGATANSLAGRFSIMNETVNTYCKSIAKLEQDANPEVLFFDIAYIAENAVDNINRRAAVYNYQLSLLNYDLSPAPLKIDDLYLSVFKGKLILRSKSLNKRLIPRLASAYNYSRSDLAIFRLLCDLQNQGLTTNLLFDIRQIIPGLKYYPRIVYKNIIISRAKWELSFADFTSQNGLDSLQCFINWLAVKQVSQFFRTGSADQTLFFTLNDEKSLSILFDYLKKRKTVIIEEAFKNNDPLVVDTKGAPYFSEWIVGLYHKEEIYKGLSNRNYLLEKNFETNFAPGGKWLYFEIFCHPQRANEILIKKIAFILKLHISLIIRWFFIRYTENGHHIRWRLLLKDVNDTQIIMSALADALGMEMQSGVVTDFSLRTYKRELARYGARNIERVESHFHVDSNYVLDLIKESPDEFQLYATCISLVSYVRDSMLFEPDSFDQLLKRVSDAMNEEHKADALTFKKLNVAYKDFKKPQYMDLSHIKTEILFHKSFLDTLRFCLPQGRNQLFADLMHMHINRLFSSDQRTHEMIFYYFMIKQLEEHKMRMPASTGL